MEKDNRKTYLTINILKALALVIPWGVLSSFPGPHERIRYVVGLYLGVGCMQLIPPREKNLWKIVIAGALVSYAHIRWNS